MDKSGRACTCIGWCATRVLLDAIGRVFELCTDDAADHGGARAESFDLIRGAAEDFIAPISSAAEELSKTE